MNSKDSQIMADTLSRVLRYGVILSAAVMSLGFALFLIEHAGTDSASFLVYGGANSRPYYAFTLSEFYSELVAMDAFTVVELGFFILLATPVARVFFSIVLFGAEGDKKFIFITVVVLSVLLFSIFATPLIPVFNG